MIVCLCVCAVLVLPLAPPGLIEARLSPSCDGPDKQELDGNLTHAADKPGKPWRSDRGLLRGLRIHSELFKITFVFLTGVYLGCC